MEKKDELTVKLSARERAILEDIRESEDEYNGEFVRVRVLYSISLRCPSPSMPEKVLKTFRRAVAMNENYLQSAVGGWKHPPLGTILDIPLALFEERFEPKGWCERVKAKEKITPLSEWERMHKEQDAERVMLTRRDFLRLNQSKLSYRKELVELEKGLKRRQIKGRFITEVKKNLEYFSGKTSELVELATEGEE